VAVRADDPARGPKDAKLTVVLFSDFQCPFCSRIEPSLKQLEEALRGQIRVVWKHQPLSMHPQAMPAAQASEAAREQGKFWQMHEKLFANQTALDSPSLARYAREIGLDMPRYERFVSGAKGSARIAEDQALAASVGASGTPNMFFNCRQVVGARPYDQLKAVADEEIAKVDKLLAGKRADPATYEKACDANVAEGAAFAAAGGGVSVRPDDPVKGSNTAPVTIVLFSDFQCPFCARVNPAIEEAVKTYGNRLKVVWKHLPLPMHPQAIAAAEASEAAREQGKFWQMHDRLFASQQHFSEPEHFARVARELGLDMDRYQSSIASGRGRSRVSEDERMAARAGIQATPTMLVNGEKVEGAVPFAQLKAAIDRKLSAAR
jgi:protein-disulfide isomerase